ncbi:MAG TPA: right-handed parallel beta-helix repeat-containing protein [Polyangiaceae bacterium]|jgi:parallel beta-helix repeat protein
MNNPIVFGSSLLLALAVSSLAQATDYYVATNGSQTNAGTIDKPFSVSKAQTTAKAGDTVYFRAGTYTQGLSPANSGTASAWITFSAYTDEIVIFDGSAGTGVGTSTGQFIRYVGLISRNHSSSGFSNGWTDANCTTISNGNQQFINVIADGNGINGIAFYCAQGLLIQQSIIAHNGAQMPSFSSGVNLFHAMGTAADNIVRQNVSFENDDISTHHSDGSGFILDQNSTGARFENNIGFRNGGSCIRLTNSANSVIVNNTCYHDGLDPMDAQGQPSKPGEIFYSDATSKSGATFFNNLAAASGYNNDQNAFGGQLPAGTTNVSVNSNGATPFFMDPAGTNPDFRLTAAASTVIDKGTAANAPSDDIGFDPKCLTKTGTGTEPFWIYAVDYNYIQTLHSVAACFHPATRSAAPDIGAYEYGGVVAGCTSAAQCDDSNVCTTDSCDTGTGQCGHAAVSGCCTSAAQCDDSNVCTTDSCNTATGQCGHAAVAACCLSAQDCDDTNPCTTDACNSTTHQCSHGAVTGCCQQDATCNDGNACTSDFCNLTTHQCSASSISGCCNQNGDCSGGSTCTTVSCDTNAHACVSSVIAGCCSNDAACNDQNACTVDSCNVATGACTNAPVAGCCLLDGDCNDSDPCTADSCNPGTHVCAHAGVSGCCVNDGTCADSDSCTIDSCDLGKNQCTHTADPACAGASGAGGSGAGGSGASGAGGSGAGGAGAGGAGAGGAGGAGGSAVGGAASGGSAAGGSPNGGMSGAGGAASGAGGTGDGGMSAGGASVAGAGGSAASGGANASGGAGEGGAGIAGASAGATSAGASGTATGSAGSGVAGSGVAGSGTAGSATGVAGTLSGSAGSTRAEAPESLTATNPGCACSVPTRSHETGAAWAALALCGVLSARRRRSAR